MNSIKFFLVFLILISTAKMESTKNRVHQLRFFKLAELIMKDLGKQILKASAYCSGTNTFPSVEETSIIIEIFRQLVEKPFAAFFESIENELKDQSFETSDDPRKECESIMNDQSFESLDEKLKENFHKLCSQIQEMEDNIDSLGIELKSDESCFNEAFTSTNGKKNDIKKDDREKQSVDESEKIKADNDSPSLPNEDIYEFSTICWLFLLTCATTVYSVHYFWNIRMNQLKRAQSQDRVEERMIKYEKNVKRQKARRRKIVKRATQQVEALRRLNLFQQELCSKTTSVTTDLAQVKCAICLKFFTFNESSGYAIECNLIVDKWQSHTKCLAQSLKEQGLSLKKRDYKKAKCVASSCQGKGHFLAVQRIEKGGIPEKTFYCD